MRSRSASTVQVKRGERLKMRCEYDNTKQNQAVVNGVRLEPRDVAWGEGTLDEMCLTYVSLMRPYEEPPVTCGDFNSCQASCAQGDGGCFFDSFRRLLRVHGALPRGG